MKICRPILLLLAVGISCVAFAQTRAIDNLKKRIRESQSPEEHLSVILDLCDQSYSLHPDTLMAYSIKAEMLARERRDLHEEIRARYYQAFALTNKGLIDSSLALCDKCLLMLHGKVNDPVLLANVLNQKGRCYMRKNQYKEAIDMGYQVINEAEKGKDILLQMKGKTLIGWAYLEMGQTRESLNWHLKALNTTTDTIILKQYGILFANLALNYNGLGKIDSALYYINKAISYSASHENLLGLSNSLAIQAQLFVRSGKTAQAEAPLKEVVEIRKLIGDPFYIVSDMAQLGLYYAHNKQPEKGIAICREGIEIARQYKLDTKLFFLYGTLADNYKVQGNTAKYAGVLEQIISLKDSVYQTNSAEALAEMQTRYDLQKKENLIIRQQLDLNQKNYLFYGLLLFSFFATVVAWLLFREYRRKQQVKLRQIQVEEKLLSAIAVVKAEEAERKRIAADLHDNLGAYAASIASNIEQIHLSSENKTNVGAMQELRNNSQSIVSQLNDTIWVLKKDALSLTAISDRLKTFIQRIELSYPDIKIDVFENIATDHLLPPGQAFHLFRILQEAVNNAVRHSGGKQINIRIESNHSWKITVSDNGKGIPGVTLVEGNGFLNMKNRSKEAGWKIEWQSNEPSGTQLSITPTTN
jgi:signal transduction histidine kinase